MKTVKKVVKLQFFIIDLFFLVNKSSEQKTEWNALYKELKWWINNTKQRESSRLPAFFLFYLCMLPYWILSILFFYYRYPNFATVIRISATVISFRFGSVCMFIIWCRKPFCAYFFQTSCIAESLPFQSTSKTTHVNDGVFRTVK